MKSIHAAHVQQRNWKQEHYKFLRLYRATPHITTGVSPADALFGIKMKTTLPEMPQPIPDVRDSIACHRQSKRCRYNATNGRH